MRHVKMLSVISGVALLAAACGGPKEEAAEDETVAIDEAAKSDDAATMSADADRAQAPQAAIQFTAHMLDAPPLGLPPIPEPADNPTTAEKIKLGEVLFNDARFSATGEVSCSTCHDPAKAFTDKTGPIPVSVGVNGLTGTRNAPTVINAAYLKSQFWDGRRPSLEAQSLDPFLNPVEMALSDHQPILNIVRHDETYGGLFQSAFGISGGAITIDHVAKAIGAFERVVVAGDSPFDRFYFAGETDAINDAAKRGFAVFLTQGRCVSCHTISQTHALFTDNRFHNLGIGFDRIEDDAQTVVGAFLASARTDREVDEALLGDVNISEIGRFAVSRQMQDIGQFKTMTLRNIAATAPYMHDGSLKTLRQVVDFYNTTIPPDQDQNGEANAFQSGGIRPLDLSEEQVSDLVAFLESLTSPQFEEAAQVSLANQASIDAE